MSIPQAPHPMSIPQAPRPGPSAQSDLEIVDDEEEADGRDNEQGDYITEEDSEEAMQYATITLFGHPGSMAPGHLFHPVTPGWRDSGRLVVVINGTVYRTLNSYNAFRATEITRERLEEAIAKGHEMLESNPDSIPDFSREGSLDEISEAFKDPETTVLALDPISEQIEYSITVRNHQDSDSDSDMGSDNTATPAHHLSPTTPAEDAQSLGFEEIPDSQDDPLT
ncbi:hypothetical protein BGX38DRAFT_1272383 [Terfezia claveryi]|nr:hypothetical protein BGX38DRAFT_1272383 [Terfezia claveryi]